MTRPTKAAMIRQTFMDSLAGTITIATAVSADPVLLSGSTEEREFFPITDDPDMTVGGVRSSHSARRRVWLQSDPGS